jgi:hypothetical protein
MVRRSAVDGAFMLIRVAIVLLWLYLIGSHVAGRLDADLLGGERDDLAARAGSRLDYMLMLHDHDHDRKVGTVSMICTRHQEEGTWELTTVGRLTDLGAVPFLGQVLREKFAGAGEGAEFGLNLHETFGADRRLSEIDLLVNFGTYAIHANGLCDQTGMHGAWDINGIPAKTFAFTTPAAGTCQGFLLVASLPAGLHPGQRFGLNLLGADAAATQPELHRMLATVGEYEDVDTEGGLIPLMHVELRTDGAPLEDVWCDDAGVVYRQRFAQAGLALELRAQIGPKDLRWPDRAHPAAPRNGP